MDKSIGLNPDDIELIVYDFDGVMTDNKAIVLPDGTEAVIVNRSDGWGVKNIRDLGISQIIISTEKNPIVSKRAEKLSLPVIQGVDNKLKCLKQYINSKNIHSDKVVYVGNDTNDIEAMKFVGWPIAPADAHQEVKSIAKIVTNAKGGEGVVREIFDLLRKMKLNKP